MNILIAPHNDDEGLFASYIIQRTKPLVVVVTDCAKHQKKFSILPETRRKESEDACKIMGVPVRFLGIPDDCLTEASVKISLLELYDYSTGFVFAPSETGGNSDHDLVSRAVRDVWRKDVLYYGTYSKESLSPAGEMAIYPTEEETKIKEQVLECYKSQHGINKPHFDAVKDKPEYLSFKP